MAVAKWKQYTKEQLQEMANQVKSNASWLTLMGYTAQGGNLTRVPKEIKQQYPDLDTSHFLGQGWKKESTSVALLEHQYSGKRHTIFTALENKRGHVCECCHNETWLDQPIPLEVHHINGNNQDNDESNLQLLCPNCHALTETYRGKNIHVTEYVEESVFVAALQDSPNIRQALIKLGLSPKGANYARAHDLIYKYQLKHLM